MGTTLKRSSRRRRRLEQKPRRVTYCALLRESVAGRQDSKPPLLVDREAGVIYGVKICGSYSANCHDVKGVTKGTRYTESCLRSAAPMYEDSTVYTDHPPRDNPNADRSVDEPIGKLRNCRFETDDQGKPCIRGDLYYLRPHRLADALTDDVERKLGVYGLSHNAISESERVVDGMLVIDKLSEIVSVDLVDRPATVRNLWESKEPAMTTTPRKTLESWLGAASRSRPKQTLAKRLIEDDMPALDADVAVDDGVADDPDEALKAGFRAAAIAVIDAEDMDAAAKLAKLKELLKAHEKLAATDETVAEDDDAADDDGKQEDDDEDKKDDAKQEEDDKEDSKEEEDDDKDVKKENRVLKRKLAVRLLCERQNIMPPPAVIRAMEALKTEDERLALLKTFKGNSTAGPRSRGPGVRQESRDEPESTLDQIAFLRRGH